MSCYGLLARLPFSGVLLVFDFSGWRILGNILQGSHPQDYFFYSLQQVSQKAPTHHPRSLSQVATLPLNVGSLAGSFLHELGQPPIDEQGPCFRCSHRQMPNNPGKELEPFPGFTPFFWVENSPNQKRKHSTEQLGPIPSFPHFFPSPITPFVFPSP